MSNNFPVEIVSHEGELFCTVVRASAAPAATTFYTQPDATLQVGKIVYAAGAEIPRHFHRPTERHVVGTSEVLVVQEGRAELSVYSGESKLIATVILSRGDVVVMAAGGHGFRFLEDTVFVEVKQGPYAGADEKVRF